MRTASASPRSAAGVIKQVEAVLLTTPYGMPSGW
jgi:hypothetical protein